jgi:pimeloyl-ACP methyl ester carboxylesterase
MVGEPPRSSVAHVDDVEWLGEHCTVVAIDLPGCGNSSPLPQSPSSIADYASALAETLTALGIERCAVYGVGIGAQVVLRFAADHPGRAAFTILDALLPQAAAAGERPAPDEGKPLADGRHLPQLWNRMLDGLRYTNGTVPSAASRLAVDLPDDLELHGRATDLLMAGPHADRILGSSRRHDVTADIARLKSRTAFIHREDDPRFEGPNPLPAALPPDCSIVRIPPQTHAWRTTLLNLLKHATLPPATWTPPQPAVTAGGTGERQRYLEHIHGQMRVRLLGAGPGVPVLLLHDVPGGSASTLPTAEALAPDRLVIAPDLPGLGESHPLPYPSLGSYVTALVEVLEHLGCRQVDVHGPGLAGCFAVALAAREPERVRRIALDGLPMVRSRERKSYARNYCPPIAPDRHGAYLLLAWQQLREQEASWPWFDRSAQAARRHDPDLDPARLQALLVDVLKQLPSYGDAARAALEAAVREILGGVRQPVLLFEAAEDVRYAGTRRAARRLAGAKVVPRPRDVAGRAAALRQFFD